MLTALEQSGVEVRSVKTSTLTLEEVGYVSIVRLHSLLQQPFQGSIPFELPGETGFSTGDDPAILCLRPGEWLLLSETIPARILMQQLSDPIDPEQTAVLDSSDGLALIRLTGEGAPWLLSKLSSLDFLSGKNQGRHCTRTKMGHVAVIVHCHQAGNQNMDNQMVFDLLIDRSYAKYLWQLLMESADHADELAINYGALT